MVALRSVRRAAATFFSISALAHGGLASVLDIACVIVIAGCVQTMFVRLRRIVRDLEGITPT